MGKKRKLDQVRSQSGPKSEKKIKSTSEEPGKKGNQTTGKYKAPQSNPIEYDPFDRILLVGEGDFSFSASLVEHHGSADLLATSFDSEEEVLQKYTDAPAHLETIREAEQTVLFSIDATKLTKQKSLRKRAPFDKIIFNFPHIGGKSTDVDRQIRGNQELLLSFFQSALPLLAPTGRLHVTLFDRHPYTAWDIRGLARTAGLATERSAPFRFEEFPGYAHVRTLGTLDGGGGWRGEERGARVYVFHRAEEKEKVEGGREGKRGKGKGKEGGRKGKRGRDEEDSSDEG